MIVLIDYGMGNVGSVALAIRKAGFPCTVSGKHDDLRGAKCVVLPGVGSFRDAMGELHRQKLVPLLNELVITQGKPFVGFCLGMQVLASVGLEDGETPGFNWISGEVSRIPAHPEVRIPHMGWNDIAVKDEESFRGVPDLNFYFMHSYRFVVRDPHWVAATVQHGVEIVAAVRKGNIFATQFHPEKSQAAGQALLKNILSRAVC
jgi:glutamine amidotransferase